MREISFFCDSHFLYQGDYIHLTPEATDGRTFTGTEEATTPPHMPIGVFTGAATYEPWHDIPSAFIMCEDDQKIPFSQQKHMAEIMNATWKYQLKSGHSPHAIMPGEVADILEKLVLKVAGTSS